MIYCVLYLRLLTLKIIFSQDDTKTTENKLVLALKLNTLMLCEERIQRYAITSKKT